MEKTKNSAKRKRDDQPDPAEAKRLKASSEPASNQDAKKNGKKKKKSKKKKNADSGSIARCRFLKF
jgi:hypothetical protein